MEDNEEKDTKDEGDNGDQSKKIDSTAVVEVDETVRPFEWLTNFESLSPLLSQSNLFANSKDGSDDDEEEGNDVAKSTCRRALHIGCGTSTLGECLAQLGYAEVVNADVDMEALAAMEKRWHHRRADKDTVEKDSGCGIMKWQHFDFSKVGGDDASCDATFEPGSFDLVVDKSTLDCALCADDGAAGLIVSAYNALKRAGGIYFVVSFHHVDFVLPLLRDCPGADWSVEHTVVERKVDIPEHLVGRIAASTCADTIVEGPDLLDDTTAQINQGSAWSSGSFQPGSEYRKSCNVFICRKGGGRRSSDISTGDDGLIHFDAVRDHLHKTSDEWFKKSNPMVTHTRESDVRAAFTEHLASLDTSRNGPAGDSLPLKICYDVLFTEAEREHLTYDYFLEDWGAFKEKYGTDSGDISADKMNVNTALLFLKEMQ